MKFARPAIEEMIEKLEGMDQDDQEIRDLIDRAREWPQNAVGLPKEEVKKIKQMAGNLIYDFNTGVGFNDQIKIN